MSLFRRKKAETRSAENEISVDTVLFNLLSGETETTITPQMALEIPAFSSAVDFIAQTVAELPVELYKEVPGKKAEIITDDNRIFALNDEAEPLMNAIEAKKAFVADMLIYGAGYLYIDRINGCLRYVRNGAVSVQTNADPVFKDADIWINGKRYYPWDFVILTRNSRNGVTGVGIVEEHKTLLLSVYNQMKFENSISRSGGNKKGFLQSEHKLSEEEMEKLRNRWREMYEKTENMAMVLNNGIKYNPSASSPMEMQLNQNKITNSAQVSQIFGLSPAITSGTADKAAVVGGIKTAVLPVVSAFQAALNRSLLTEAEKHGEEPLYFALDITEILRADTLERYQAYAVGLQNNFLQIDEVRYMEDKEPLGVNYIKLGLQDVLLDPKTNRIYTPNTNKTADMKQGVLTSNINARAFGSSKVIAIDFDGCICSNAFPGIGTPNWNVIERAKLEKSKGAKLILWTCREGERLNEAVKAAANWGLEFDAVNKNVPELIGRYGNDSRKIGATEYWDDKAVNVSENSLTIGELN